MPRASPGCKGENIHPYLRQCYKGRSNFFLVTWEKQGGGSGKEEPGIAEPIELPKWRSEEVQGGGGAGRWLTNLLVILAGAS